MKNKLLLIALAGILFSALLFTSCEKTNNPSANIEVAEDEALSTLLFDDIFAEVENAMSSMEDGFYGGFKKSTEVVTCKTITVERPDDETFWPRTVTIDYGEGCEGFNGRVRSGKIIIVVNKRYMDEDHYRTVTFEDFYIDDFKMEGTKTLTNEGLNEDGNMVFKIVLEGGKIIKPDGEEIIKEFNKEREWVAGMDTPRFRRDDVYMVTGTASGVNRKMVAFTRTIVTPLKMAMNCRWIKSGVVEIEREDMDKITLDYGDGECDRLATVTIGDEVKEIRLHR